MSDATILYVCPYCTKGRFTAADGFEGAKRHIREKHRRGDGSRVSGKNSRRSDGFDDSVSAPL